MPCDSYWCLAFTLARGVRSVERLFRASNKRWLYGEPSPFGPSASLSVPAEHLARVKLKGSRRQEIQLELVAHSCAHATQGRRT